MPERTNQTQGSATPLPHILYSAASEYGAFSHLTICRSVLGFTEGFTALRCVSQTSVQNEMSYLVGSGVSRPVHHQSGKPCSRAHSVGVSRRTV